MQNFVRMMLRRLATRHVRRRLIRRTPGGPEGHDQRKTIRRLARLTRLARRIGRF